METHHHHHIDYIEFCVIDMEKTQQFYRSDLQRTVRFSRRPPLSLPGSQRQRTRGLG